jgi:hypothetical protein
MGAGEEDDEGAYRAGAADEGVGAAQPQRPGHGNSPRDGGLGGKGWLGPTWGLGGQGGLGGNEGLGGNGGLGGMGGRGGGHGEPDGERDGQWVAVGRPQGAEVRGVLGRVGG